MNNPQVEHGFIRLATGDENNDLLTALIQAELTGVEYQVVLYILRKTYGYKKKEDWISLDQFVDVTGRTHRGILNALIALDERKIIIRRKEWRRVFYSINKTFHTWSVLNNSSLNKSSVHKKNQLNSGSLSTELPFRNQLNSSSYTKENVTKNNLTKETPTVVIPIFSPHNLMPDFIVMPSDDGQQEKPQKKKQPFNWQDYQELTRLMKQACGFTSLTNGTKPQDNYARHILMFLLKVLVKEHEWPEQEAIDQIRFQMEEFCQLVQRAREADKFLHSKMTSLQEIYFELKRGRIFEASKMKNPKNASHLSL